MHARVRRAALRAAGVVRPASLCVRGTGSPIPPHIVVQAQHRSAPVARRGLCLGRQPPCRAAELPPCDACAMLAVTQPRQCVPARRRASASAPSLHSASLLAPLMGVPSSCLLHISCCAARCWPGTWASRWPRTAAASSSARHNLRFSPPPTAQVPRSLQRHDLNAIRWRGPGTGARVPSSLHPPHPHGQADRQRWFAVHCLGQGHASQRAWRMHRPRFS